MWWEVSIYKSIKIPQAKKAADSCKKDCLVCQYKCYCTTESQLLHLTGWMWTSVSWQRQLYSMHGVFPSPGNSAELVLVWRSLLWLERLAGCLRSVCTLPWDLGRFVLCISGVTAVSCAGLWCFLLLSFEHRRDGCDGTAESWPSWNQP